MTLKCVVVHISYRHIGIVGGYGIWPYGSKFEDHLVLRNEGLLDQVLFFLMSSFPHEPGCGPFDSHQTPGPSGGVKLIAAATYCTDLCMGPYLHMQPCWSGLNLIFRRNIVHSLKDPLLQDGCICWEICPSARTCAYRCSAWLLKMG